MAVALLCVRANVLRPCGRFAGDAAKSIGPVEYVELFNSNYCFILPSTAVKEENTDIPFTTVLIKQSHASNQLEALLNSFIRYRGNMALQIIKRKEQVFVAIEAIIPEIMVIIFYIVCVGVLFLRFFKKGLFPRRQR